MPQFDISCFLVQIIWLFIVLIIFYILICFYFLPVTSKYIKARRLVFSKKPEISYSPLILGRLKIKEIKEIKKINKFIYF